MAAIEKGANLEKCYYWDIYTYVVPHFVGNDEHLIVKNIYYINIQFWARF